LLRGPMVDVRSFADTVCVERGVHRGRLKLISVETHQAQRRGSDADLHVHLRSVT